jgi:aryl-alcohol dehydrogenase-like predicted oxidoreductase
MAEDFSSKRQSGCATAEGTTRYARRFTDRAASEYFHETTNGLTFSSIGIGTYLGEADAQTDSGYADAVVAAVEGGINVIDTAINYRLQRSERSVGDALRRLLASGFLREELVIATKAGFLTPDGEMPADPNEYFAREYLERGVFAPEDIAGGCHCMSPAYLANQLERSLGNLGLKCLDIFYLHNPETQLGEISREQFHARVLEAFKFLEEAVRQGKVAAYGLATWNAFRASENAKGYLSLEEMVKLAQQAGGEAHHFKFVQLPMNLAMPEAFSLANQTAQGKQGSMAQAARLLGITLISSAALLQGQLLRNLPPYIVEALGLESNLQRALQFARSTPGITTALVGMSRVKHVQENLKMLGVEPATQEQYLKVFGQGRGH